MRNSKNEENFHFVIPICKIINLIGEKKLFYIRSGTRYLPVYRLRVNRIYVIWTVFQYLQGFSYVNADTWNDGFSRSKFQRGKIGFYYHRIVVRTRVRTSYTRTYDKSKESRSLFPYNLTRK